MPYHYILSLILFFITISLTAQSESDIQQTAPNASASKQEQPQTNTQSQPTVPPTLDKAFTNFDFSTPEKASISFVNLYNGIIPASPTTDIEAICTRSALPSYQKGCLALLGSRLSYLKGNARNLQGVMVNHPPPTQLSKTPMQLKASWLEVVSFFDGTTKNNKKDMTITLQQSGKDWKIINIEQNF